MKLETYFKPENIGKTYKMMYNNKEIKVIFVSDVAFYQEVPRKELVFVTLGDNNRYAEISSDPNLITQVTKSRATKELREYADKSMARTKYYKKNYSEKLKANKKLASVYEKFNRKAFSSKLKKNHTTLLNDINFVLETLAPNFKIALGVEDYDENDMEEYGVQDINDTLHYELLYNHPNLSRSTVELEYFTLSNFKMPIANMKEYYPNYTYTQLELLNYYINYAQSINK